MTGLWPSSPQFAAAITQTHTIDVIAEVLVNGVPEREVRFSSDGVAGSRGNFSRRSCSPTLLDPTLVPKGRTGDLIALGNEVRLWRGISDPLTDVERVPLITGRIIGGRLSYDNGRLSGVAVDLNDRCTTLAYARFSSPVVIGPASAVRTIQLFVSQVFPDALVNTDALNGYDVVVPRQVFARDRDEAIKTLANALGAEFYVDPLGQFVLAPIPDPSGDPDLRILGGDGGNLITGQREFSDSNVYNGIVVTGQTSDAGVAPISDLIVDSNPMSPTFWGGVFNQRPGFIDNAPVTTKAQANVQAKANLRNTVGLARSVSLTVMPDPRIQEGAVLGVTFLETDDEPEVYEQHIVDTINVPTEPGTPITLSTRATQVVAAVAS